MAVTVSALYWISMVTTGDIVEGQNNGIDLHLYVWVEFALKT
jgi:hypothetical protein